MKGTQGAAHGARMKGAGGALSLIVNFDIMGL
jgi:hypothetical protein